MKKTNSLLKIILFASIISLFSLGCSPTGTSNVTIHINLRLNNKAAFHTPERSIFDRVFSFIVKKAEAQSAPSNIISLSLNILGSGMDTITQNYPAPPFPDTITVEVPAGSARMFEVLASTPSAILRGTATRDLSGGAIVDIPINMGLYETKIIIPDYRYTYANGSTYYGRIIQINDYSEWSTAGYGWATKSGYNISQQYFYPFDVDFDNSGKIYIATNDSSANYGRIFVFDDFTDNIPEIIALPLGTGQIEGIAIDRINNYIYFTVRGNSSLYRCDLSGTSVYTYSSANLEYPRGIAVDEDGYVYIVGGSDYQHVYKFNPNTGLTTIDLDDSTYSYIGYPWDVIVKGTNVYVSNFSASNGYLILQYDQNLQLINNYGNNYTIGFPAANGEFFGPHRFLAILNSRFYLIDEDEFDAAETERLLITSDYTSDWLSFIPNDAGIDDNFQFYSYC